MLDHLIHGLLLLTPASSYVHLDFLGKYSYLVGSIGIVYPMLSVSSGITAQTNFGYEIMLGLKPIDNLTIGMKQLAFSGKIGSTSFNWNYFSYYVNASFPLN